MGVASIIFILSQKYIKALRLNEEKVLKIVARPFCANEAGLKVFRNLAASCSCHFLLLAKK